jgi:putative transposase
VELRDGTIRKRRRSYEIEHHLHEITCSCYKRLRLLNNDLTRRWLVDAIAAARISCCFELRAYVIMPEHFHLLILPRAFPYSMAGILKTIKQPVAMRAVAHLRRERPESLERLRFTQGGKSGYRFWQPGGGYDRNIFTVKAAINSVRYMHRNPVKAGLCEKSTDWVWSSAQWYKGEREVPLLMDRGVGREWKPGEDPFKELLKARQG